MIGPNEDIALQVIGFRKAADWFPKLDKLENWKESRFYALRARSEGRGPLVEEIKDGRWASGAGYGRLRRFDP
ncbi:hypothetical protein ElyMa_002496600 [Elysia marginata]|uniref:Uncharacterized protein n=1 Tax=Elysia marginata TaxID=1093978 RepID=A0AAV4GQJ7_9GAST|nr:hypothetical protein ElyMa_002496600 [Elysia marginata]